jgi:hypothetical protein
MVAFNKNVKFAQVVGDDTRGVAYKQNGRLFNHEFQEVNDKGELINGKAEAPIDAAPAKVKAEPKPDALTPTELLKVKDLLPFKSFKKQAGAFLTDVPNLKADIVARLELLVSPVTAPIPVEVGKPVPGMGAVPAKLDAAGNPIPPELPTLAEVKAKEKAPDELRDKLHAWADKRINQKMLFGDVVKALRTKFNKVVHNERDAMNFLIDEGVVQAEFARNV